MYLERNQDLSVYHFVEEMFEDVSFVTIVDGFPDEELSVPTVSIDNGDIDTYEWELGNRNRAQFRTWYIDVFAKNKSQRDDFSYKILNEIEEGIPVYDYSEGFPPEHDQTKLGALQPEEIKLRVIQIAPELVDKLYYRTSVEFTAVYNQF